MWASRVSIVPAVGESWLPLQREWAGLSNSAIDSGRRVAVTGRYGCVSGRPAWPRELLCVVACVVGSRLPIGVPSLALVLAPRGRRAQRRPRACPGSLLTRTPACRLSSASGRSLLSGWGRRRPHVVARRDRSGGREERAGCRGACPGRPTIRRGAVSVPREAEIVTAALRGTAVATDAGLASRPLLLLVVIGALSLLPFVVLLMTSFVKIAVVLSVL